MAAQAGVLLHGRGGRVEEMLELAARLGLEGIRWVAPEAETGSWYPRRFMEPIASNEPFLSHAVAQCARAVEEASEGGRIDPGRISIGGFSQGACLATEYVLRHPGRCGAVMVFTGALIGPPDTDWEASTANLAGLRVLITGSDIDKWVSERRVRDTARVLTALGAEVQLHIYKGRSHVVSDEEVALARHLIGHASREMRP
jgi:phospholipase/carboxylesterase